jgi:hypothetical protein
VCLGVVLLLKGMNSTQLMDYINDRLIDHHKRAKKCYSGFCTIIMSSNISYCLEDLKLVLF